MGIENKLPTAKNQQVFVDFRNHIFSTLRVKPRCTEHSLCIVHISTLPFRTYWIINEWAWVFIQPLNYSALWSKSKQVNQVELCSDTTSFSFFVIPFLCCISLFSLVEIVFVYSWKFCTWNKAHPLAGNFLSKVLVDLCVHILSFLLRTSSFSIPHKEKILTSVYKFS